MLPFPVPLIPASILIPPPTSRSAPVGAAAPASTVVLVAAVAACTTALAVAARCGRGRGRRRRTGRGVGPAGGSIVGSSSGQATAEYALVLLGAAAIALMLAAWAAKSGAIGRLFDAVVERLIDQVG